MNMTEIINDLEAQIEKLKLQNKKLKMRDGYVRDAIIRISETVEDNCISGAQMMLKALIENMGKRR
jgi:3-hydroxyacyl-CoA dehydrogenase